MFFLEIGEMMQESIISCPKCKHEFKLTESLAAPLMEKLRLDYERRIQEKEADVSKREAVIRTREEDIDKARTLFNEEVEVRVKEAREKISFEESRKARALAATDLEQKAKELTELQELLNDRNTKLKEAQSSQAEMVRKQRELDDAKRELDLTIERRVQENISAVREKAKLEAEETLKLRITEREHQISSMARQIEDLKRKAEQGSQQLQGEAQEIELEQVLRSSFPLDSIDPIPKGESGADVLQKVVTSGGQHCGAILWEVKRTKNWSDGWLAKLRNDQRAIKADFALLVSQALPKEISSFGYLDGVWVTETSCAIPLAISLRQSLVEVFNARQASAGQKGKMELVYQYLTGPNFKHRIEAFVERFNDMQADLDRERRATIRLWAKRESQIRGMLESTAGMWGDLQGIAGKSIQEIEGLTLERLEAPANGGQGESDDDGGR
jgi:hypothetical protein